MNASQQLHALGQSLWLDNISRDLLDSGTLQRYCDELSVTGLTSNPSIFEQAIGRGTAYDAAIRQKSAAGKTGEALFFELAIEDLTRAAAIFQPLHAASGGLDGWVSLEVSPLLADDAAATLAEAKRLHAQAACPNLLIKIPGTPAGVKAIEEAIFAGVPVNVTLLFSREQYIAAADAYWRGIQRRIEAGLDPRVVSVASIFISRWDVAVAGQVPANLGNQLGIAIARRIYKAACQRQGYSAWKKFAAAGALPQRLLWASTGTKDPQMRDTLYVEALAAPGTINTLPEKTLLAFADHGELNGVMPEDGGDAEGVLADFALAGIDIAALATRLQRDGALSFVKSWTDLLAAISEKCRPLTPGVPAP
ncbi:transaldolase [Quatrionicoccus australiensis]|uniref:transaldolase n=1 Tax=Quatrionicoccus australiensis TaxID=138118 RepID=UPI001CF88D1C|nr:transaldolase [Quatrionicoccus australiensis]UCV16932.1 transaldolase [Quatrionicoccus australiensis]